MFVIDFLITMPLSLYMYIIFPDTPHNTQAFYLTFAERKIALNRLSKPVHVHGSVSRQSIKRAFTTWHIYGFCFIWTMGANCEMFSTNAVMNLYLKSLGRFSIVEVNYLPAAVSGVGIVATL